MRSRLSHRPAPLGPFGAVPIPRVEPRAALAFGALGCVLLAQGAAISHSPLWAAPLLGLLLFAVATDLPLVALVSATLVVRVLTSEAISSPTAQYSGSVNLSGAIAMFFVLLAAGLLARRRRGVGVALLGTIWLAVFTAIAVHAHGVSTESVREGVREISILALALIVLNSRGAFSVSTAVRIVQLAGLGSALLAIYQLATHTGMNVEGEIRANGTFTHPNGAAMYFAIAVTASLWRYLDQGRNRSDAVMTVVFAAAAISTFSIGGLASLLAMLIAFGGMRPGSVRLKLGSCAVAALVVIAFAATPLGAKRLESEASTHVGSAQTRAGVNSTLAWRIYKWRTLIPEWERAPFFGQGLGATVSAEGGTQHLVAARQPHNEYVRYAVETGLIGLLTLLCGLALLMRALARRRRDPQLRSVATLAMAVLIGCMVNGLGDNTLLYTTTGYAAGLIIAAVLCFPVAARPRSRRLVIAGARA